MKERIVAAGLAVAAVVASVALAAPAEARDSGWNGTSISSHN